MKKLMFAALVSLAILPGCGKKKEEPAVNVAPALAYTPIGTGSGGVSGCASLSWNSGQTITFYGQVSGFSGITANLQPHSYGSYSAGYSGTYSRSLPSTGDSVNVYVSGSTAYAVVYLAPQTVNAILAGSYGGGGYGYPGSSSSSAAVCGFYINANIVQNQNYGTFSGNLSGTLAPLGYGGSYIMYPGTGTPILL